MFYISNISVCVYIYIHTHTYIHIYVVIYVKKIGEPQQIKKKHFYKEGFLLYLKLMINAHNSDTTWSEFQSCDTHITFQPELVHSPKEITHKKYKKWFSCKDNLQLMRWVVPFF